MGTQGRPSITKRQKEQARQARAKRKAERRAQKSAERRDRPSHGPEEDPDIAGIVPGPQPLPWDDETA